MANKVRRFPYYLTVRLTKSMGIAVDKAVKIGEVDDKSDLVRDAIGAHLDELGIEYDA